MCSSNGADVMVLTGGGHASVYKERRKNWNLFFFSFIKFMRNG